MRVLDPNGNPELRPAVLDLKQSGATLIGTVISSPDQPRALTNGKAENGKLTFQIPVWGGVMTFTLTQDGDDIKGDVRRQRDGRSQTATLAAKRLK